VIGALMARYQPAWLERVRLGAPTELGFSGELGLFLSPAHIWRPEDLFVQIISKIDETGTHADSMLMAGYAARLVQWNNFDLKWTKRLKKNGPSYFHAKEHAKHPFSREAPTIADKYLLFDFVVRMDKSDYNAFYKEGGWGGKAQPDSMYGLCFRYCLSFVLMESLGRFPGQNVTLNFVLDDGHPNCGGAAEIVRALKKKQISGVSEHLGYAVTEDDKRVPGLQAADGLAYGAAYVEKEIGFENYRNSPAQRIPKIPTYRCHADGDELKKFKDGYFEHIAHRRDYWRRSTELGGEGV
jgi:hypothetical protein